MYTQYSEVIITYTTCTCKLHACMYMYLVVGGLPQRVAEGRLQLIIVSLPGQLLHYPLSNEEREEEAR